MFEITIEDDEGNEFTGHFTMSRSGNPILTKITPHGYSEEIEQRLNDAGNDSRYDWMDELRQEYHENNRDL
jgi:hypothetical protein